MPHNTDMPTRYIADFTPGWCSPDMELGHWVTGSMGHLSRPGHRVIILTQSETRVFSFFKKMPKMQNVHLWKSVQPSLKMTFNKWSSKFYFPEACKRQTAIKTGKPLAHCKRLSHNYGTNIALPGMMQILLFGAGYKYSYLLTYLVEYSSTR